MVGPLNLVGWLGRQDATTPALEVVGPANGRQPPRRGLRRDIQGLRAVAVLAVIGNHMVASPIGGFVGVDVFFVISGLSSPI